MDEQEQKRQHARQSLERYMHYWQRWAENDASRKKVGGRVEWRKARPGAMAASQAAVQCGAAGSLQCFQAHQTLAARPALIPALILSFIFTCLQALQQVERFRNDHQEVLSERTATPTSQLKFITDAWMQARWRSRVHFALCLGAVVVLLCTSAHLCVQGRDTCRAGSLYNLPAPSKPYPYARPPTCALQPSAGGALPPHPQVDLLHRILQL